MSSWFTERSDSIPSVSSSGSIKIEEMNEKIGLTVFDNWDEIFGRFVYSFGRDEVFQMIIHFFVFGLLRD